ncbi:hypothetical protein L1887_58491 [Cichorium endivia]|nr:hypothetical protein L1887_58491 [Cichorium endivia]
MRAVMIVALGLRSGANSSKPSTLLLWGGDGAAVFGQTVDGKEEEGGAIVQGKDVEVVALWALDGTPEERIDGFSERCLGVRYGLGGLEVWEGGEVDGEEHERLRLGLCIRQDERVLKGRGEEGGKGAVEAVEEDAKLMLVRLKDAAEVFELVVRIGWEGCVASHETCGSLACAQVWRGLLPAVCGARAKGAREVEDVVLSIAFEGGVRADQARQRIGGQNGPLEARWAGERKTARSLLKGSEDGASSGRERLEERGARLCSSAGEGDEMAGWTVFALDDFAGGSLVETVYAERLASMADDKGEGGGLRIV